MAVERGEFAYPKPTGPKFEFSDDDSDEGHDDASDEDSDEDRYKGKNGREHEDTAAPEPKVTSSSPLDASNT